MEARLYSCKQHGYTVNRANSAKVMDELAKKAGIGEPQTFQQYDSACCQSATLLSAVDISPELPPNVKELFDQLKCPNCGEKLTDYEFHADDLWDIAYGIWVSCDKCGRGYTARFRISEFILNAHAIQNVHPDMPQPTWCMIEEGHHCDVCGETHHEVERIEQKVV